MPGTSDRYIAPKAAPHRSLRSSLLLLLLIPALTLLGLWGAAAGVLVADSSQLRGDADLAGSAGRSTHELVISLQEERRLTAAWQATPGGTSRTDVDAARTETDAALSTFRTSQEALSSASPEVRERAEALREALSTLPQQRDAIDERSLDQAKTFTYYTDTVDEGAGLIRAAVHSDGEPLAPGAGTLSSLLQVSEMVSREDAMITGAFAAGRMTSAERDEFAQYVAVQRQGNTVMEGQELPEGQTAAHQRLLDSRPWAELVSLEDAVVGGPESLPEQEETWRDAAETVGTDLRGLSADSLDAVVESGSSRADELMLYAILGTVLALAALGGTILLAQRFSGSLLDRLSRLSSATMDLADNRLPQLVERLGERGGQLESERRSEEDYGGDELGRLAEATHHLGRAVEDTLLQQARGREGTEQVFLGLARRTQVLIGRLIPKLDELERKHQDSDLLKDIFAVDHLATRVRRHTENLVILGGSPPVRRWSRAVPIYEVLRSAISETEDYRRVEAQPAPQVSLIGPAVADVVHLLAELIENGTSFSPPDTTVSVSARTVARGLALEVEDRGLGMPDDRYEHINRLLAEPPKLDMLTLGETPRLGHFVVARLASRHNLEISLRRSPYGGTLAIVLLPSPLLEKTKSLLSSITEQAQGSPANGTAVQPREDSAVQMHSLDALSAGLHDDGFSAAETDLPAMAPSHSGDEVPHVQAGRANPETPAALTTTESLLDDSGYPAYGGAGLLPSAPPHGAVEEPSVSSGRTHPPEGPGIEAGYTTSVGNQMAQDPPEQGTTTTSSSTLPTRVRGESLAEPLRKAMHSHTDSGEPGGAPSPSPDRAGAAVAAIQAANRRARREATSATPAGDQDPQAETRGHGAGPHDR